MRMKRTFAMVLCAVLMLTACLTALPTTSFAAGDKAIQLGTDGIDTDDKIYFGKYTDTSVTPNVDYDVPWLVLNMSGGSAFLLSEYLLGNSQFLASGSGYYKDSTLNIKMDDLYNGTNTLFTSNERSAIASKTNLSCADGGDSNSPAVPTAYLYPLSYNEANAQGGWGSSILQAKYITAPTGSAGWWWLRSSYNPFTYAFCVNDLGNDRINYVNTPRCARPAFNLDKSKVLFSAAADNSGQNASFSAPAAYSGTNWKLTLKDGNSFAAGAAKTGGNTSLTTGYTAEVLTFRHAALSTFTGAGYTNVTAALTNTAGDLLYYGSINTGADATSSTVTIPAGLATGSYTLSLYAEDRNAANTTDYATGTPFTQTITVTAPAPSIIEPAANRTVPVTVGSPATFTVTATNARGYQWFRSTDGGQNFAPIAGETGASYTTAPVTAANNGYQYRCVVTGNNGQEVMSPVFTLNVTTAAPAVPETGDDAPLALLVGVMLLAGAGLALRRRRRRNG